MAKKKKDSSSESNKLNAEFQTVAEWLKKVKFKKKTLGGVSESDVWKKLEELNALYEAALAAERARYDALLEEYRKNNNTPEVCNE